jgi:hypothetical protein
MNNLDQENVKVCLDDKFYYCIPSEGDGKFDMLMECCAAYQAVIQLCYHSSNWFISLAGFFENKFCWKPYLEIFVNAVLLVF